MTDRIKTALGVSLLLVLPAFPQSVTVAPGWFRSVFHAEPPGTLLTSLTVDPQGRLYVLSQSGVIKVLEDTNGDHVADVVTTYWPGTAMQAHALGILWFQGSIFVNHGGTLTRFTDVDNDLVADTRTDELTGLPLSLSWHQNNDLFTDGTYLYFGLGSVSDHTVDPDPRSATLQRYDPATQTPITFATGLRNVFDGLVHPVTGDIFAGDNGPNFVSGNPDPPDEVDWIRQGYDYGHPNNWGAPPPMATNEGPIGLFPPHASPVGMTIPSNGGLSGFRNEIMQATFGGALGTVTRIPVFYGPLSGHPAAWISGANTLAAGAGWLPIDVESGPPGSVYVLNYVGQVEELRQQTPLALVVEGPAILDTTVQVTFTGPPAAGYQVFSAAALLLMPVPIPLAPGVDLHLDVFDPIFTFSITPGNGIFNLPQPAPLDAQGQVTGSIYIPNVPPLVGVEFHLQAVAFDPTLTTALAATPPVLLQVILPF